MKFINWVTHPSYDIPLPLKHRFTSSKFSDLFTKLQGLDLINSATLNSPSKANEDELSVGHCINYISRIKSGSISKKEERKLGLTWSPELSNRSFLAVNGTLLTAKLAIENGIACHLAGGTHHAQYNFGSGFCVFNDLAYTSIHLLKRRMVKKILIFDCDVHQGDGTANILADNPNVFTCSIHSRKNFPVIKANSDLDIELEDEIGNKKYQDIIEHTIKRCVNFFQPDLVLYDAGIDVHVNDQLGRLNINDEGCLSRDLFVLSYLKKHSIPVATVIGGGYSKDRIELANRHSIIFRAAHEVYS